MARRTLRNLDERILKKTVAFGAAKGAARVSTKKIASVLTITEPTIYVHFKTKVNLLYEAYIYAVKALYTVEGETMKEKIIQILDNSRNYPEAAAYISSYRFYEDNGIDAEHPDPILEECRRTIENYDNKTGIDKEDIARLLAGILTSLSLLASQPTNSGRITDESLNWLLVFLEAGTHAALEKANG